MVKRRMMQRKITVSVLIVLLSLTLSLRCYGLDPVLSEKKKEVTLRNMTREVVFYTIAPINSRSKKEAVHLGAGVIHGIPTEVALDIDFQSNAGSLSYELSPGKSYSFRYDEDNFLGLYEGSHGRTDAEDLAPFVPTPMIVVEKMLRMAAVDKTDVLYDLGSGDGRIVIAAAKKYGARAVGIELDPELIKQAREAAKKAGVEHLVEFRMEDATKSDFSDATVVTLYLLPESNELLRPRLEKQLKPGAYVVSHNYSILGWEKKEIDVVKMKTEDGELHEIYLYRR
jgi:16S rRNA G966 N2-methylase RsmD